MASIWVRHDAVASDFCWSECATFRKRTDRGPEHGQLTKDAMALLHMPFADEPRYISGLVNPIKYIKMNLKNESTHSILKSPSEDVLRAYLSRHHTTFGNLVFFFRYVWRDSQRPQLWYQCDFGVGMERCWVGLLHETPLSICSTRCVGRYDVDLAFI